GTGKTYLYNALLVEVRSRGSVALTTASSGAAANNLPASMAKRHAIEVVDRTMQDIMGDSRAFRGKVMVMGGEYKVYHSFDEAEDDKHNLYPLEFLNSWTRMICRAFDDNVIDAEITVGQHSGKRVFLPRIPLAPSEDENFYLDLKENNFYNEIYANTDEDGDVMCGDGSYKSISPTDKLVVFDASHSSVTDNYVCSSDVCNRERFNVTCGLEITEKPVVKCKDDALWFQRLTGRSDVVVYPIDCKFYSPRRKVFYIDDLFLHNSKLYTDCSLEMNVDEAMKSEVVHDYSDKKIVVKLEELSIDSVSNDNMVNNKEVFKKERIIRRALNAISSCQSKLIDIESSDDEDLSVRVRVETIEGETLFLTPAGHPYNWNRMVCRNVDHLYNFSKMAREVKEFDLDMAERVMEVVREDMCNIVSWMHFAEGYFN
nr:hypothetical protein [Tanacetum cinerariifolium]